MVITVARLREIIASALRHIGKYSAAAEQLVLGTAVAESLLTYRRQIRGPALGLFQMEPATHHDIYINYLRYPGRAELRRKVIGLLSPMPEGFTNVQTESLLSASVAESFAKAVVNQLIDNDRYAAAMCRIRYLRAPQALPAADDIKAMAQYWKDHYNTKAGKGTPEKFLRKWRAIVTSPRASHNPSDQAGSASDQLTTNFRRSEFDCNDGTPVPKEYDANVLEVAKNLQVLRDELDRPIRVNSGYRSPSYNRKVGGVSKSQHLLAKAADIVVRGMKPGEVKAEIEKLIESGQMKQGGIGLYNTFIHYDVRGSRARW